MISQSVEYALRAVVSLAYESGRPCTAGQLSELTKVSPTYLSKIMLGLVRAGIAESQRGPGGGFTLARSPKEITVWEVVEAVEPVQRIRTCPLGLSTHGPNLCPLHRHLDNTMATVEKSFKSRRVADLLGGKRGIRPLCESEESE